MTEWREMGSSSETCETIHWLLADYAEGRLPVECAPALEAHLESCAECRAELARLREVLSLLERRSIPVPEDAFFSELRGFLHEKTSRVSQPLVRTAIRRPSLAPAFAAATMLIFLVLWWTLPGPRQDGPGSPFMAELEREAKRSLLDLGMEDAGTAVVEEVLPTPSTNELIAGLSESQLERLAERLEDLMG